MPLYRSHEVEFTVATATTQPFKFPSGSKEALIRWDPLTNPTWKHGTGALGEARVDAGDGFPMLAGEALAVTGPMHETEMHFRHADAGSVKLHIFYLYPNLR